MARKRIIIPEEVKAEARRLYESGVPCYTVAKRLGVHTSTVDTWSRTGDWVKTLAPALASSSLDGAIAALGGTLTEAAYDERLRQVALSVPWLIGRMDAADLVAKSDKVAKLVQMSREILGKGDNQRGGPIISVGILSAGGLPRRVANVELIENERVGDET